MAVRGGVGVDHHVEPSPNLPEGAAGAVTEEATAASGRAEADAASEQVSLNGTHNDNEQQLTHDPAPLPSDAGALNGSQEAQAAGPEAGADTEADAGAEAGAGPEAEGDPEAGADPISYSQADAFSYEQAGLDDYRQDPAYTTDYPAAQSGYNDGVTQSRHNDGMSSPVGPTQQNCGTGSPPLLPPSPSRSLPPPRYPRRGPRSARRHRHAARTWSSPGSSPGRS
jgi:hypothetical protein